VTTSAPGYWPGMPSAPTQRADRLALLIVGGGPAAMAAARGFRAVRDDGRIALVTDEGRIPYRRPPLTKELLRREATDADLPLEAETWPAEHRMDLVAGRVVALDPHARRATLSGGRTLDYERCVLATGAEPTRPPVPGVDDPAVRVLRSREDLAAIEARLSHHARVVVIGSGFVGCEIAASLRRRGLAVTQLTQERAPLEARVGPWAADRVADWLWADGVALRTEAPVSRIARDGDVLRVHTAPGPAAATADLVVLAAGVAPRIELAIAAGLDCPDGRVPTDARLRTAAPDLWAAGDVAAAHHALAGRPIPVEHWGDALAQGEVAGRAAAGDEDATWDGVPGFWSSIGHRVLKHAAWGDGYAEARPHRHASGAFTVTYHDDAGDLVGVLTHDRDDDYEAGRRAIADAARRRIPAGPDGVGP